MLCKKKKKKKKSKQCTLRYADGGSVLLTRAIGRKACSPGRIRLVLIQFICRCVQHHQEKKSGPQRHRPLNTDYTTKCREAPPALCVIHKTETNKKKKRSFCSAGNRTNVGYHKSAASNFFTLDSSLSFWLAWQIEPMSSLHGFIWERWTLRVLRLDQSERRIRDRGPGLSTTNW